MMITCVVVVPVRITVLVVGSGATAVELEPAEFGQSLGPHEQRSFRFPLNVSEETKPGMNDQIVTEASAYAAAAGAHAIAVLTEWDEFKTLDYQKIYDSMAKPAFLFDGRNICDHDALRKIGFDVYAIGKPTPPPF